MVLSITLSAPTLFTISKLDELQTPVISAPNTLAICKAAVPNSVPNIDFLGLVKPIKILQNIVYRFAA